MEVRFTDGQGWVSRIGRGIGPWRQRPAVATAGEVYHGWRMMGVFLLGVTLGGSTLAGCSRTPEPSPAPVAQVATVAPTPTEVRQEGMITKRKLSFDYAAESVPVPEEKQVWQDRDPGLRFMDVALGQGKEVDINGEFHLHYTEWLPNADGTPGKKIASSRDRGQVLITRLPMTVAGWSVGLAGAKVGGIRRILVPPQLAFGDNGRGEEIPPGSTVLYEVEILDCRTIDPMKPITASSGATPIPAGQRQAETRQDGVVIWDQALGSGPELGADEAILFHYTIFLADGKQPGTKVRSSHDYNNPDEKLVGSGELLRGLEIGLLGIKEGGRRRVFIPANLAWGQSGTTGIPPNSDLVYEVEALKVKKR